MNFKHVLSIIILLVSVQTHAHESIDSLLGKWKVTSIEITNIIKSEAGNKIILIDTSVNKTNNLINGLAKGITEVYLNSNFHFKKNNKFKIKSKKVKIKGTFIWVKEKNTIITDIQNFKKLFIYKIFNKTLIINRVDENEVIRFTLLKY